MKIIYPNDIGGVAVVYPTGEIPVERVAEKDVPAGKPFRYVEDGDLPADGVYLEVPDFTNPDGYGRGF
jgi:hypothetical protein